MLDGVPPAPVVLLCVVRSWRWLWGVYGAGMGPTQGAVVVALLAVLVYLNLPETPDKPVVPTTQAPAPAAGAASKAADASSAAASDVPGAATGKTEEVPCKKHHKKANKSVRRNAPTQPQPNPIPLRPPHTAGALVAVNPPTPGLRLRFAPTCASV